MMYYRVWDALRGSVMPQAGLDNPNNVISIILPTGVQKLRQIDRMDNEGFSADGKEATGGIFGISLKDPKMPLVPADHGYCSLSVIMAQTKPLRKSGKGGLIKFQVSQEGTNQFITVSHKLVHGREINPN